MKTLISREQQRNLVSHFVQSKIPHPSQHTSSHDLENNSTSAMNDSSTFLVDHQDASSSNVKISIIFGVIFISTGCIINLHDLYRLWTNRKRWSSTHVFLFGLAVSDTCVALLALPGFVVYTTSQGTWPLGVNLCLVWLYVDWITTLTTSSFVMVILLSHVTNIHQPAFFHKISSRVIYTIAAAVSLLVYANSLLLPVYVQDSIGIQETGHSERVCFVRTYQHSNWLIAYFACGCYVPVLVIVLCWFVIWTKVTRSTIADHLPDNPSFVAWENQPQENLMTKVSVTDGCVRNSTDRDRDSKAAAAIMSADSGTSNDSYAPLEHSSVMALGTIFLLCWLPGYIYDLFEAYGHYENDSWHMFSVWLIYFCAVLNPIALHLPKLRRIVPAFWHSCRQTFSRMRAS